MGASHALRRLRQYIKRRPLTEPGSLTAIGSEHKKQLENYITAAASHYGGTLATMEANLHRKFRLTTCQAHELFTYFRRKKAESSAGAAAASAVLDGITSRGLWCATVVNFVMDCATRYLGCDDEGVVQGTEAQLNVLLLAFARARRPTRGCAHQALRIRVCP